MSEGEQKLVDTAGDYSSALYVDDDVIQGAERNRADLDLSPTERRVVMALYSHG